MKKTKAAELTIGDAIVHIRGSPIGVVVSHIDNRGLVRVKWESHIEEWLPPEEVRLLRPTN